MLDPFLVIAETLELSRAEVAAVERYRADPESRSFLPMADVLRTHHRLEEAIELMIRGVANHPGFSVARVILARELYQKGLLNESLLYLQQSPVSLADNALAQKLLLRLHLLSDDPIAADEVRRILDERSMLDEETRTLSDVIAIQGFDAARASLVNEFRSRGIELRIGDAKADSRARKESAVQSFAPDEGEIDDFARVPLSQVFADIEDKGASVELGGVSLDSTTLAEIYEKQRLYSKALEVYRRLLRVNPGSEFLKQQLRRVAKMVHEQRQEDLEIDASIVDEMEQIEVIDRQIRFYTKLLNRLS
jgi:predicted Zn-dependent protease